METILFTNHLGQSIVEFDGTVWMFYSDPESKVAPERLSHDQVVDCPFVLFHALETVGDGDELMARLGQESKKLQQLVGDFFSYKRRLMKRIILFEKTSQGMLDEFTDRISIFHAPKEGFVVEASIESDFSHSDHYRNAVGEIVTYQGNINSPDGLIEVIDDITSEEHWDEKGWTWKETLSNLARHYPDVAAEVDRKIKERGMVNPRRIKNELYYFKRIETFHNGERYDYAIDCANEGIEKFPFSPILPAARGESYFSKGDIEKAIKDYETALQMGMEEASLLNNLGICYVVRQDFSRSVECFTEAIALRPDPNTYMLRAKAYREMGNFDLAKLDHQYADNLISEREERNQQPEAEGIKGQIQTMGKIIKYCDSCDEGFAEKFDICPICGKMLGVFREINAQEAVNPIELSEPNPSALHSINKDIMAEDMAYLREHGKKALAKRVSERIWQHAGGNFVTENVNTETLVQTNVGDEERLIETRFAIREEPLKWSREIFGGELLVGDFPLYRLSRMFVIETLRKSLDVVLVMVLWGTIIAGLLIRLGSPWWAGGFFAFMFIIFAVFYISTTRVQEIGSAGQLSVGLSKRSPLIHDDNFIKLIGNRVEKMTRLNKIVEVIWGLGLMGIIPLMSFFLGAYVGIEIAIISVIVAFLLFVFTAKTNTGLFKMAVNDEETSCQGFIEKFKDKHIDD